MTTKELIKSEIDSISDEDLDELYKLVKEFARSKMGNGTAILLNVPRTSAARRGCHAFAGHWQNRRTGLIAAKACGICKFCMLSQ